MAFMTLIMRCVKKSILSPKKTKKQNYFHKTTLTFSNFNKIYFVSVNDPISS